MHSFIWLAEALYQKKREGGRERERGREKDRALEKKTDPKHTQKSNVLTFLCMEA
jgi:hypothetical protein